MIQIVDWPGFPLHPRIGLRRGEVPAAAKDIQGRRAMSVFLIADIAVTDDGWVPAYAANVHGIAARHGGTYLSRSGKIEVLEGEPKDSSLIALIRFPSRAALQAFAEDPEYQPYAKARQAGSVSRLHVIDDCDLAGKIPYLAKG